MNQPTTGVVKPSRKGYTQPVKTTSYAYRRRLRLLDPSQRALALEELWAMTPMNRMRVGLLHKGMTLKKLKIHFAAAIPAYEHTNYFCKGGNGPDNRYPSVAVCLYTGLSLIWVLASSGEPDLGPAERAELELRVAKGIEPLPHVPYNHKFKSINSASTARAQEFAAVIRAMRDAGNPLWEGIIRKSSALARFYFTFDDPEVSKNRKTKNKSIVNDLTSNFGLNSVQWARITRDPLGELKREPGLRASIERMSEAGDCTLNFWGSGSDTISFKAFRAALAPMTPTTQVPTPVQQPVQQQIVVSSPPQQPYLEALIDEARASARCGVSGPLWTGLYQALDQAGIKAAMLSASGINFFQKTP